MSRSELVQKRPDWAPQRDLVCAARRGQNGPSREQSANQARPTREPRANQAQTKREQSANQLLAKLKSLNLKQPFWITDAHPQPGRSVDVVHLDEKSIRALL